MAGMRTPMRECAALEGGCSFKVMGRGSKVQEWLPGSGAAHPLSILSDRPAEQSTDRGATVRKREA